MSDHTFNSIENGHAYKDAGVDIKAGEDFVRNIKPHAEATNRPGIVGGLGGYGGLFDLKTTGYKDPILVSTTDGVGTKIIIAREANFHSTIGIDLVAMCVNDLIVQAAEPLFFLDYIATGKLDTEVAVKVVEGIADGCRQAGCALIGGETAEMPGMYSPGDYDLAGFAVGAVERNVLLPRKDIRVKDVIVGLASNALHSNGFSLVRKVIREANLDLNSPAPFESDRSFAETLLMPTRIYVRSCLAAIKDTNVKALAHITGGGLVHNVPRILPKGLGANLFAEAWKVPPVFKWLANTGGITPEEMAHTFNCGIGMILIISPDDADAVLSCLNKCGETASSIGEVIEIQEETPRIYINKLKDALT